METTEKTTDPRLPEDMTAENTACFTGHRILPEDATDAIREKVRHAVRLLSSVGYRYFLCGGAVGFDMLAEDVLIEEKAHADVHLILALPCRNQTEKWQKIEAGTALLREYQRVKGEADAIVYLSDFYTEGCMRERNRFMVEHSSFCVAYYNGYPRSGAGQTYRMAKKAGHRIYNVYDAVGSPNETENKK